MINYIHDIQEKSFYLNDSTSQQYVSEENIYDKPSYNSSTQPCKCKSTASLINSSFNTTSSGSSSAASITNTRYDPQVLYEEIYNFGQPKFVANTYENEMVKPKLPQTLHQHTNNNNKYKREYTVNEIFQNLKKFKEEAIQQEKINTAYSCVHDTEPATTTIDKQNQPKSVSFLKQIFETKLTKKTITKSNECLNKQQQQQQQQHETKNSNHLYVNDKLNIRQYKHFTR